MYGIINSETFEAEREGQLPIILHTKTREIIERRRKTMKKLLQERSVSRTTSESQETVVFLGKAL
jgi:tyrosine-protein phosphatase YwqE